VSDIDKLLNSLLKSPGMRVMHFTNEGLLCKELQEFCKSSEFESEYLILTLNKEYEQGLKEWENSFTKVKFVNEKRPKYHMQSKQYDYLFIETLANDRVSFFKKVYSALKNAAPIFIFLAKNQKALAYTLQEELIECNFVASNIMEFDNFLVVSSKKMHGWSGS